MYRVWVICKESLILRGKSKRRLSYLTPLSNSWWINNSEFGEKEAILRSGMGLREEICQLQLRRHILKSENLTLHSSAHKEGINTYVFG
jgi:hypothetical protein